MTLVCQDLELIEKEYFSLTYRDANNMKVNESFFIKILKKLSEKNHEYLCKFKFWLDHDKKIKDQLAALWPFLAIVAEVIVLCLIILIYEKKCNKKPSSSEEDTEVTHNL